MVLVDSLLQRDMHLGWIIGKHKQESIQHVVLQIIVGEEILLVPTFRKHIVATKDGTSYLYVHRVIIEQTPLT